MAVDDRRWRATLRASMILGLGMVAGCGGPPPTVRERANLSGDPTEVHSLAFAPDGKSLVSRTSRHVRVWDVDARKVIREFPSDGSDFGSVVFTPDGRAVAADRVGTGPVVWDLESGRPRAEYDHPRRVPAAAVKAGTHGWGLACSPDGRTLASGGGGGDDGFVTLWDLTTGAGVDLGPSRSPVTAVAFAPDGRTIASGNMGGAIDLWDVASRLARVQIQASRSYLAPVVFAPDGRTIATASTDRRVKLWDATTGQDSGTLKGHLKAILAVAYHPDGRLLASGDSGGTLFLWDLAGRRTVARLVGHQGKIWALAFRPDGKLLASAGEDGGVHLWDVPAPE